MVSKRKGAKGDRSSRWFGTVSCVPDAYAEAGKFGKIYSIILNRKGTFCGQTGNGFGTYRSTLRVFEAVLRDMKSSKPWLAVTRPLPTTPKRQFGRRSKN